MKVFHSMMIISLFLAHGLVFPAANGASLDAKFKAALALIKIASDLQVNDADAFQSIASAKKLLQEISSFGEQEAPEKIENLKEEIAQAEKVRSFAKAMHSVISLNRASGFGRMSLEDLENFNASFAQFIKDYSNTINKKDLISAYYILAKSKSDKAGSKLYNLDAAFDLLNKAIALEKKDRDELLELLLSHRLASVMSNFQFKGGKFVSSGVRAYEDFLKKQSPKELEELYYFRLRIEAYMTLIEAFYESAIDENVSGGQRLLDAKRALGYMDALSRELAKAKIDAPELKKWIKEGRGAKMRKTLEDVKKGLEGK